jgi:hypothetical protein
MKIAVNVAKLPELLNAQNVTPVTDRIPDHCYRFFDSGRAIRWRASSSPVPLSRFQQQDISNHD